MLLIGQKYGLAQEELNRPNGQGESSIEYMEADLFHRYRWLLQLEASNLVTE